MKVIDLLVKISKGEELPKEVIYNQEKYTYKETSYGYDYINENYGGTGLFKGWCIDKILNDEVIVIEEEKEIEKLNLDTDELLKNVVITAQDYVIEGKINELIDAVNELKRGN